jgi:hypothetical protein
MKSYIKRYGGWEKAEALKVPKILTTQAVGTKANVA